MRFSCFHLVATLTVALPLLVVAQTNSVTTTPPPPEGVTVLQDVVFGKEPIKNGGTQDLHADIAFPTDATKPLPAVIFIHGGGWINGTYKNSPIEELAKAGYVGVSIEYRLDYVGAKWPAQIQDCKLAVQWLRANAAKYHVDPGHIGAWGKSAGGHLAVCLGTFGDEQPYVGNDYPGVSGAVQAVVDFYGPVDLVHPGVSTKEARQTIELLFGVPPAQNPILVKSASPLYDVKAGNPPMLIVHGDSDVLVPVEQSKALDQALTKAGVTHQFIVVKNAGHSFTPLPGTVIDPSQADINKAVIAFLDKYLKGT
jgi:acetyl esterase/lipase